MPYVAKRGKVYKSKLEGRVAKRLSNLRQTFQYEPDRLPYFLEKKYTPDFKLENGIYLEVKGILRPADRTKMRAVKDQHPELDIRFVFQDPTKTCMGIKETHAEWADRNGFPWYSVTEFKSKDLK